MGVIVPPNLNGIVDESSIPLDLAKLAEMPTSAVEREEGYQEEWGPDEHQKIRRVYGVPWTARDAFKCWAIGYQYTFFNDAGTPTLCRIIPAQDPEHPWLYAESCRPIKYNGMGINRKIAILDASGEPVIPSVTAGVYSLASSSVNPLSQNANDGMLDYEVIYTPRDYEIRNDTDSADYGGGELNRYVVRDKDYSIQSFPVPLGQVFFTEGPNEGTAIPAFGQNLLFPREALVYRWLDVPDEPILAIKACMGKVNESPFDGLSGALTYDAQTLLCLAPKRRRKRSKTGRVCWEVTYNLLFQPQTWNKFPDATGAFYEALYGDDTPVYQPVDFDQLFKVPDPVSYQ